MARQSKRLVGPTQLGVSAAVGQVSLCTPATGTGVTLKHIKATNCDTSTTHYLCVSIGADVVGNRIIDQIPIAPNAEYERFVLYNLTAGEILCAGSDAASKIALTIDGDFITIG